MRGPYVIETKLKNVLSLVSVSNPPPPFQPHRLNWSMHAKVYSLDAPLVRSVTDPASSQLTALSPCLALDCILTHKINRDAPNYCHANRDQVEFQLYSVRFWGTKGIPPVKPKAMLQAVWDATEPQPQWLSYNDVKNTMAFDSYAINNPQLKGHSPILNMPAKWDPHAVNKALWPMHDALPAHEREFPPEDEIEDGIDDDANDRSLDDPG